MKSPVLCPGCGTIIGQEVSYPWTAHGQDPPETIWDDEESIVYDKNDDAYCSQACLDRATGAQEEESE